MSEINVENQSAEKKQIPQQDTPFTALKNLIHLSGRAGRKEFWMLVIFISVLIPMLLLLVLSAAITSQKLTIDHVIPILLMLPVIFSIVIMLASVRRLHDTNRSAWYQLLHLLPILGSLMLFILCCLPSQQSENRYGPNPGENKTEGLSASLVGFLLLALSLISYAVGIIAVLLCVAISSIDSSGFWNTSCSQTARLKNLGLAISAYQQQNNNYLPDKKGLEGLQQLKTAQKDLAFDFNCKNGAQFAYVGNGLSYPYSPTPTIICISKAHPYHIHYVNAAGEVKCLKVKKHPEKFTQAVVAIFDNDTSHLAHIFTFGLSILVTEFEKDRVMQNAHYIDNPQLLKEPENKDKTSPAAAASDDTSPEQ